MADLRGDDRGQILLVAAFALAVIFIGLAMVTNSAIYTENVATRGEGIDANDALEDRHAIEQAAGDAIEAANWNDHTGSYSSLRSTVEDSMEDLDDWTGLHVGLEGTMMSTTVTPPNWHREGRRLVQTNGTTFESSDAGTPEADWLVAGDVNRTRAFEIEVTDLSTLDSLSGTPFTVNVTTAPTANWTMSVAEGGVDEVVVEVERESPDETEACRVTVDEPFRIDVTGATVDGEPCPALDRVGGDPMQFGAGVAPGYDIRFENGDSIEGNYSLIVEDGATILGGNYGSPGGSGGQPYDFPAMYHAIVQLEYHSKNVDYVTEIRVAPGEPDA